MKASPLVVILGETINITCLAVNGKVLYNADYQFFLNGIPAINAPSNSSHIMVNATSSGNFTCNATQYSDQGTAIPSPVSLPVQTIVLGKCPNMEQYIICIIDIT